MLSCFSVGATAPQRPIAPILPAAGRNGLAFALASLVVVGPVGAQTVAPLPTPSAAPASAPAPVVPVITPTRPATAAQPVPPAGSASAPAARRAPVAAAVAPEMVIDISRPEMADLGLHVGESRVLKGLKAARVVIGSESVASAAVLDSREIVLFGNGPGTVTMQVWDTAGRLRSFRLTVRPTDMQRLADDIRTLLSDVPNVRVVPVGDKVVIDGDRMGDENLFKIAALTKTYAQVVNLTEYQKDNGGWDRMVMMDVRIVEFKNKDKVRELGVQWDSTVNGPAFGIAGDIKSSRLSNGDRFYVQPGAGVNIGNIDNLARPIVPFRTYAGLISVLNSKINLLASDGDAVVLAEPQLTARSGRQASMNVGGRIPLAVSNGLGDRTVTFERFGVQLKITPWATRNGTINSSIRAEISEPDGSLTVNGLPGFRERVVETVFNVQDGQTMVISGLLQRSKASSVNKVPLLGDIPLLGHAFKSTRETESESEVVVFVTPTVVDAEGQWSQRRIQDANERAGRYLGFPTGLDKLMPEGTATEPPQGAAP